MTNNNIDVTIQSIMMEQQQQIHIRICRTCLREVSVRENMLSVHKISGLLMSYTSLQIIENDGLPSNICSNCHKQANDAYRFVKLCEESDQKLRNEFCLLRKNLKDESVKSEYTGTHTTALQSSSDVLLGNRAEIILQHSENPTCVKDEKVKQTCAETNNYKMLCDIKGEVEKWGPSERLRYKTNCEKYIATGDCSSKRKKYCCRFCDTSFKQQARLLRHELRHEGGISCYICEKTYSTFKQLRSHINIHNRKGAHLCQTCGKQFTLPENLVRHQRIHTGTRPYKCKLCNKSFTQSNELKSHLVTHSSEKTHLCNVCGNKYARHMSLQVHLRRMHSDASIMRPYPCEICGRTFKDKRDLSQHVTIHKGERKHACKICGKAFNRSSNLKVHERIHSGHRPFVCHICQKAFIQKHVLNTHLRTHPNINT